MRKNGVSSLANRWLNKSYKILAITVVFFAVLISTLRILLPYAQEYRQELQNQINARFDSNIAFLGAMSIEWTQDGPLLIAENVRILQTEAANVFIQKIDFQLDFWGSIRQQRIQTKNLKLSGAKIYINASMMESLSSSSSEKSLITNTFELFLEQITKFSLQDSQLVLRRESTNHVINIDELRWLNEGERHRANGNVIIAGLTENTLKLKLDVIGDSLIDMRGQMYLEAKNLDITPWLGSTLSLDDKDTDADINFQAWMSIDKGLPRTMNINLGKSDISYQYNQEAHRLQILDGDIQVNHLDNLNKLSINSNDIELFTENYAWQPFNFSFVKNDENEFFYVSSVDLEGVTGLLPLFLSHSQSLSVIDTLSPKGELNHLYLRKLSDSWQAVSDFSHVSSQYNKGIPGIKNASGQFVFSEDDFYVNLLAKAGELDFGENFNKPLPYEKLLAQVKAYHDSNGWNLQFSDISLDSHELTLQADVGVKIPKDGQASMSLLSTVNNVDASNIPHYYPQLLMGDNLVNYLTRSIEIGKAEQAVVLFNGKFTDFPFKDNSGVFTVNAELVDGVFSFDPNWPAIQAFNANLNFTNDSMLIKGRSGRLQSIKIKDVEAEISSLSDERVLTVDAHFMDAVSGNMSRLMNNSPLSGSVGETLKELAISGLINGHFNLNLPLKSMEDVVAQGTITFNNNQMNLQTPSMFFTALNGDLSFRNDVVTANNLSVKWEGLPLTIKVNAQNQPDLYHTQLNINALWHQQEWQTHLPKKLHPYAKGDVNLESNLNLNMHHDGEFTYDVKIASLLKELTLELPAPYAKRSQDEKHLQAYALGNKLTSTLEVSLDDNLNFYGVLDHSKETFTKSHLVLGQDSILLPLEGFYITTQLDEINFSEWQPFIFDIVDATQKELSSNAPISTGTPIAEVKKSLLPAPEKIRGKIAGIDVYGQKFTDISFDLLDEKLWWKLSLNAKEIRSETKFYSDWIKDGVEIDADFIHLAWQDVPLTGDVKSEVEANVQNTLESTALDSAKFDSTKLEPTTEVKNTGTLANEGSPNLTAINENKLATNKSTILNPIEKVVETSGIDRDELFSNMPKLKVKCDSCTLGVTDFGKVSFEVVREASDIIKIQDFKAKRGKSNANFNLVWQHNDEISNTQIIGDLRLEDIEQEIKHYGYPSTIRDSSLTTKYDVSWQDAPSHFDMNSLNGNLGVKLDDGYLAEVSDKGTRIFSILSLQSLVRKLTLDFRDIFSDGMFYTEIKGDFSINEGVLYTQNTRMKGAAGDLNVKGNTNLIKHLVDYRLSYKPNLTSSLPVLAWIATLNPVTFLAGVALNEVITSQVVSEINFELTGDITNPVLKEVDRKSKDITVGRSTPPQVVETKILPKTESTNKNIQNQFIAPVKNDNEPQANKFNG